MAIKKENKINRDENLKVSTTYPDSITFKNSSSSLLALNNIAIENVNKSEKGDGPIITIPDRFIIPDKISQELKNRVKKATLNSSNSDLMFGLGRSGTIPFLSFLDYLRKNEINLTDQENIYPHLLIGRELTGPMVSSVTEKIIRENYTSKKRSKKLGKYRSDQNRILPVNRLTIYDNISDTEEDKSYTYYYQWLLNNAYPLIDSVKENIKKVGYKENINIDIFDDCFQEGTTALTTCMIFSIALKELGIPHVTFKTFEKDLEENDKKLDLFTENIPQNNNNLTIKQATVKFHHLLQIPNWKQEILKNTLPELDQMDSKESRFFTKFLSKLEVGYTEIADKKTNTFKLYKITTLEDIKSIIKELMDEATENDVNNILSIFANKEKLTEINSIIIKSLSDIN